MSEDLHKTIYDESRPEGFSTYKRELEAQARAIESRHRMQHLQHTINEWVIWAIGTGFIVAIGVKAIIWILKYFLNGHG